MAWSSTSVIASSEIRCALSPMPAAWLATTHNAA